MARSFISIWLEAELGTRSWVVAPALTARLKAQGYTLAISRKRFAELVARATAERKPLAA